jgi:DNA-binding CsgD family transcriptional regulator
MKGRRHVGDGRELLVGEIYRAILGAAPVADALGRLAQLTNSDKAFWGQFDQRRRAGCFAESFNARPQFPDSYNSTYSTQNVWLAKSQYFQLEGLVWRGSKIVPMQELTHTQFYKDFLAAHEVYHTLHITIAIDGDQLSHVMLTRPQQESDFGESEIETAQCFALHARRALEDRRTASGLQMIKTGLAEVTEDAGLGVAILDPPSVIYASLTCEKILASLGAPTVARNGGSMSRGGQMLFPRAVAEAINGQDASSATSLIIDRPDGGKVLACIRAFPLDGLTARRAGLIVTFLDLSQHVVVDENLLQRAYDLTASEARVCSFLANGESVEDVSERLRISPNTARTHIKRIFSKTGSTRQAQLVKLILTTAAVQRNARSSLAAAGAQRYNPARQSLANGSEPQIAEYLRTSRPAS